MVNVKSKIVLEQIMRNNPLQPLIVVGQCEFNEENAVFMDADIAQRELHFPTEWKQKIVSAANDIVYLVIKNPDVLDLEEQNKFVGLLKDRRAGNFKLPSNVRIVIAVNNLNALNQNLKKLALVWEI